MKILSSANSIKIYGNIKSISHFQEIKQKIDMLKKEFRVLQIHLLDSISLTSSVIGHLCQVTESGHRVELYVKNENLYELLDDLNLLGLLNVQKI